jgi:hypothetical protein
VLAVPAVVAALDRGERADPARLERAAEFVTCKLVLGRTARQHALGASSRSAPAASVPYGHDLDTLGAMHVVDVVANVGQQQSSAATSANADADVRECCQQFERSCDFLSETRRLSWMFALPALHRLSNLCMRPRRDDHRHHPSFLSSS